MADLTPIDYTSKDFASLRQAMLDDAARRLPEWTSRSPSDFGVVLIEEFAYVGDIMSHYIDRLANESFLSTATLRESILAIAQMLDYRPDSGRPAKVTLTIGVVPGNDRVLIPRGSQFSSRSTNPELIPVVIFETDSDLYIDQTSTVAYGQISATQGETVRNEAVGISSGSVSQIFLLERSSVIEGSTAVYVDEGDGPNQWVYVDHLIEAGPLDAVFTTFTNAFGRTEIRFGDGVNGRVPYASAAITSTYRTGGGIVGNVGAQTIDSIVDAPMSVSSVSNSSAAEGGTDPESNDQIRRNAPLALSTLHRAVSLDDYRRIALNVSGVAKSNASGLTYTNIAIVVAPSGGGQPSVALKDRIVAYLADRKMVNARITVVDPIYVPVVVNVTIEVSRSYFQATVRNGVVSALSGLVRFENVDFEQGITLSDVYRQIASVPGVESARVTSMGRSGGPLSLNDITLGPREILSAQASVMLVTATGGISTGGVVGGETGTVLPGIPGQPVLDSLSCTTPATVDGQFTLTAHWIGATDAATYQLLLDFFNGSEYVGSQDGGTFSTTSATVNAAQVGADTLVMRVRAINSAGATDGASTTVPYPCGNNLAPTAYEPPTSLQFTNVTWGPRDAFGNVPEMEYTVTWSNPSNPPDTYVVQQRFIDGNGAVLIAGQSLGQVPSTLTAYTRSGDGAPAGAVTLQFRMVVRNDDDTLGDATSWIETPVTPTGSNYAAPTGLDLDYFNYTGTNSYGEQTYALGVHWTNPPNGAPNLIVKGKWHLPNGTPMANEFGATPTTPTTYTRTGDGIPAGAGSLRITVYAINDDNTLGAASNTIIIGV